ncbi:MAG: YncE family protein, partial [Bacteroidia bacterium]|nr:YncE family protein [Bacteroidia bacterium]
SRDGRFDLLTVDEMYGRLYLSHGTEVNVVDLKTNKSIATIPNTLGVHGITIASDLKKGFTSNGKDTSVTVFNSETFQLIETVKIPGINPDAILYDAFSKKVFVFNGKSNDVNVIDAKTNKVISTIPLPGKPELCTNDNLGSVFVNIEDKNMIVVIDAITLTIKHEWSIAPGEEPTGLSYDHINKRLFSVCSNKLMVVLNAENGKVIKTIPIGDGCDGVEFDEERKLIYTSNGDDGTMTVMKEVNADSFQVIQTIITQKGAKTIALDKKSHRLFLPTAEFGETPPASEDNPNPKRSIKPNTFVVLVVE